MVTIGGAGGGSVSKFTAYSASFSTIAAAAGVAVIKNEQTKNEFENVFYWDMIVLCATDDHMAMVMYGIPLASVNKCGGDT